ncbi:tetratricopeptide repeat protein, partial [Streptomyces sp. NPDC057460]|uniref:tetratricopeptide repeat protein n=1 Tax=Streptomyces sp. NPDC057460 TaxID=3346141 RepID=UPI0036B5E6F8
RAWLESEAFAWLAALRSAARRGEHTRVVETAAVMEWCATQWLYWGHWPEVYRLSSQAAAALGDPYLQADHLNYYAWALTTCEHRNREAIERADEALECARRAEDVFQQARALTYTAIAHRQLGEAEAAADKSLAAADLFEVAGDHEGWTQAMRVYGVSLRLRGRPEEAMAQHERVIAFLDAPDCPVSGFSAELTRTQVTSALGLDYAALGQWHQATDHLRSSLFQARSIGFTPWEGHVLVLLGEVLIELGETEEARSCLRQALALGDDAADPEALKTAQKLLDSIPAE